MGGGYKVGHAIVGLARGLGSSDLRSAGLARGDDGLEVQVRERGLEEAGSRIRNGRSIAG